MEVWWLVDDEDEIDVLEEVDDEVCEYMDDAEYRDNDVIDETHRDILEVVEDDIVKRDVEGRLEQQLVTDENDYLVIYLEQLMYIHLEDDELLIAIVLLQEHGGNDELELEMGVTEDDEVEQVLQIMDDDEVELECVIVEVLDADTNEYLYLGIQALADITLLEVLSIYATDIVSIALLQTEL